MCLLHLPVLLCAGRDRLFEAGFDDDVTVSWLGQAAQMPTSAYSQYLAVAVVAGLGVAGGWVGWLVVGGGLVRGGWQLLTVQQETTAPVQQVNNSISMGRSDTGFRTTGFFLGAAHVLLAAADCCLLVTAAAGFTLGALREVQKLQKMQVVDR